jgi:hypothetical protein
VAPHSSPNLKGIEIKVRGGQSRAEKMRDKTKILKRLSVFKYNPNTEVMPESGV